MAARAQSHHIRDLDVLDEGLGALEKRLGQDGAAEFLRLVGANRGEFLEIRRRWNKGSVDSAVDELRKAGLL